MPASKQTSSKTNSVEKTEEKTVAPKRTRKPAAAKAPSAKPAAAAKTVAAPKKAAPKRRAATKAKAPTKAIKLTGVPEGLAAITPMLVVRGAEAAIEFYKSVFGAEENERIYAEDGVTILKAVLTLGTSKIALTEEMPAYGILSPLSTGAATSSLQFYNADIADVWAKAVEATSLVLMPLEDTYWGERTGKLVDPFGQVWTLAQQLEALTADEIKARFEALVAAPVAEDKPEVEQIDDGIKLVDLSKTVPAADAPATPAE